MDPSFTIYNINGSLGGYYYCITSNLAGFDIVNTTIFVRPYILAELDDIVASSDTYVTADCLADGFPTPTTYQWTYVRTGEVETTEPLLELLVSATIGGDYQCVTGSFVGYDIETFTLYVIPEIEVDPYATNVSARVEPIELSCTASGFPFPNITWVHNGTYIDELDDDITIMTNNSDDSFGTVYSNLTVYDTMISDSGDYMCIASNGFGADAKSENATVLVQDVPHAPFDLEAMNVSSRNLTLTWIRPFESNAPILGYFVFYSHPSFIMDGADVIEELMEREEMLFIDDLHPGVTYYFTVIAYNEEGNSTMSDVLSVRTMEEAPGGPPTNVRGNATSPTSIFLYWELPEEEDRHGVITSYDILYSADETDNNIITIEEHSNINITLRNLLEHVNYTVIVRARTEVGEGPYSNNIFVRTDETFPGPPDTPTVPSDVTSTTATLEWTLPPDPNGIITGYEVEVGPVQLVEAFEFNRRKRAADENVRRCLSSMEVQAITTYTTTNTSLAVSDLLPFAVYQYRVRAMTIVGFGNFSEWQTFNTLQANPGPIDNLQGIASNSTSILVQWDYPSCPNNLPTHYRLFYTPGNDPQSPPINSDGYSSVTLAIESFTSLYTITGLTAGQSYKIHVQPIVDNGTDMIPGEVDTEIVVELETSVPTIEFVDPVTGEILSSEISSSTSSITTRLPSIAAFGAQGITNITYYGVIVAIDPNPDFDLANGGDFEQEYPDLEPYDSRGNRDYYITAGWNDDASIPDMFEVGDESRTTAVRNEVEEEYFNAKLGNGQSHCVYVMVHSLSDIGDQIIKRYTEVTCQDTRLGYNREALISLLVIIFVIILILILVIVLCVCCWRRRRDKYDNWVVAENTEALPHKRLKESIVLSYGYEKRDPDREPIAVVDFPAYVTRMHNNNDYLFSEEYAYIEPEHSSTRNASLDNKAKNRFLNIIAYDHSRVILEHSPSGSDYINASHIGGYGKTGSFIATQAPLSNTVGDFWCMVWEQNASVVVMLTKLEEKDRVKCHQYWPQSVEEDNTAQHGPLTVKFTEELKQEHRVIRTFTLSMPGEETRRVRQYQFMSWPDHGTPVDGFAFLEYIQLIKREYNPLDGPMVVHCSAGVGRTGTFIAIYVQLARIAGEKTVDIYNYVRHMRRQRNLMVQNEKEYIFIHDAIVQALIRGEVEGINIADPDSMLKDDSSDSSIKKNDDFDETSI